MLSRFPLLAFFLCLLSDVNTVNHESTCSGPISFFVLCFCLLVLLQLWAVTEASSTQQRVHQSHWRSVGSTEMAGAGRPNPTPTWTLSEVGWSAPPLPPPLPHPLPLPTRRCPRHNCALTRQLDSVTMAATAPISMATCVRFADYRCCTHWTLSKDEHMKR